ncbi:hypothetical protein EDB83DRAFT_2554779 [Lactarius deliciosus]|nr:hypothetical protein EDB83DRAFT_2554779 [Lactarius deliciosus]
MESAPRQALYAGSRSNRSLSQETKPNMGGATLMFTLLALRGSDVRDRPLIGPHLCDRGSGRNWQREWVGWRPGLYGSVSLVVTYTKRSAGETTVKVAVREFFDSDAGKKIGHDWQRQRRSRIHGVPYTAYHLSERRRLACWAINTLHMDSPHNLSGCSMRANDWELEEERALKIIGPPGHVRWKCCRKESDVLVDVTFVYSSFGVTSSVAVTGEKKNNKVGGPPLCERPANVGKWQKPDPCRTKLHRRRLYLSYESPSPEIAAIPAYGPASVRPSLQRNTTTRDMSPEILTDWPLPRILGLTARPSGSVNLGACNCPGVGNYMCSSSAFYDALRSLGGDPAMFMVKPTVDGLLAANSMQDNDVPLSSGSTATDASRAFNVQLGRVPEVFYLFI